MEPDARQIANWFVERAQRDGKAVSIMSLLKLVYIAHGWHLETQGAPLFANRVEAWKYGPVIPDVYHGFRSQGINAQQALAGFDHAALPSNDRHLLEQVWTIYGNLSPFKLSDLTHVRGGPWDLASKMGGNYAAIPNELIAEHYADLRRRASEASKTTATEHA